MVAKQSLLSCSKRIPHLILPLSNTILSRSITSIFRVCGAALSPFPQMPIIRRYRTFLDLTISEQKAFDRPVSRSLLPPPFRGRGQTYSRRRRQDADIGVKLRYETSHPLYSDHGAYAKRIQHISWSRFPFPELIGLLGKRQSKDVLHCLIRPLCSTAPSDLVEQPTSHIITK